MTLEEYRQKINSCYGCGCWDEDMGCMMPSADQMYACSLRTEEKGDENDN